MVTFFSVTAQVSGARQGPQDVAIREVCADSREVTPGALFVAVRGERTDGHAYIPQAIAAGAAGVVLQDRQALASIPDGVAALVTQDSRRAAAVVATAFWGDPSRELTLVGVTGTNGKTTVTHLVDSILRAEGHRTGLIGTLGRTLDGAHWEAARTTPDAIELQRLLRRAVGAGVSALTMEVSSHALELDRTYGCAFDAAVFTNLTQDHLDFHVTEQAYLEAKLRLFTEYALQAEPKQLVGAINMDDAAGREVARRALCRVVTYAASGPARVTAEAVKLHSAGIDFTLNAEGQRAGVRLGLIGRFNLANALAAAACCHGLGMQPQTIVQGLERLQAVPGRFERVDRGQDFLVIVDYAHTPDALRNVLETARQMRPRRLICVFGCGGDRDRGKRPLMGKVATELADWCVITSDNPRSEDPLAIIAQIETGAELGRYEVEPDREAAIRAAIARARVGDIVLIAGKGHETYQEFSDRTIPFDDRSVAAAAIESRPAEASQ